MRIRFELQSLAALGEGIHDLPINCWRLTLQFQSPRGNTILVDGVNFQFDLESDPANRLSHLVRLVAGGVMCNGLPVNLDQVLRLNVAVGNGALARGVIMYEYLEP